MGVYPKYDHAPLLAPGRHYMTLTEVWGLCVEGFSGPVREAREKRYHALEEFIQKLLISRIRCDVFLDGSLITEKPNPDDVDFIVDIDHFAYEKLSDDQKDLLQSINSENFVFGVQSYSLVRYPREHPRHGSAADLGNAGEAYGLEHAQVWLKGYVVIRLWETDVGNRICR